MQDYELTEYVNNYSKTDGIKSTLVYGDPGLCPDPYVSIVIPTFRRADLLRFALDSALNQKDAACSYEVIVVDNEFTNQGPSDTRDLLISYQDTRLLYYQNEDNLGMVGNMNRCIQLARGQWVAFLHDDDILVPEYLNKVIGLINRKKQAEGIMARFDLIDENYEKDGSKAERSPSLKSRLAAKVKRNKLMRLTQLDSIIQLSNRYGPPTCGSIFPKKCLMESGGFNDSLYPSFDWFFLYRYCKQFQLYKSMEVLGLYRISVNVSLSDKTKSAFIRDRIAFTKAVSRQTRIGRFVRNLFEYEQNRYILDNKFTDYHGKEAGEYFERHEIQERKARDFIFQKLLWVYWQAKEKLSLVFG